MPSTSLIIILILSPAINLISGLLAILVATIVESLPINIDDKLTVPLVVAIILSIG